MGKRVSDRSAADNARVAVYPPVYFAVPLAVGLALDRAAPVPGVRGRVACAIGIGSIAAGLAIAAAAIRAIGAAGSDVRPNRPTTALVEGGVFAATRNPIYVGGTAVFVGAALLGRSRLALVLLPIVLAQLDRHVVDREERYLERTFGERYRTYHARVPRWF